MLINIPDYFQGQGYLHFFECERKRLNILPLQLLSQRNNTCFQSILVNTAFEIPSFHKSIALPDGELLLIGGTLMSGAKSSQIYKFDFKLNTLNSIGKLILPRSSHALCYLSNCIYVIGGFDSNQQALTNCERFTLSPKTNLKNEQIASLNIASASFSVTTFNENSIYKFGGVCNGDLCQIIEKYNKETNSWIVIDPKVWIDQITEGNVFGIYSMSIAVQLNSDQILVCGGYNEEGNGSDLTFVFQDSPSQEQQIKSVNWKKLPVKEGFWNNQAIVFQGKIIILQNVVDENDIREDCREDARRILIFDGKKWVIHQE